MDLWGPVQNASPQFCLNILYLFPALYFLHKPNQMQKNRPILKWLKENTPEKIKKEISSLLPAIHLMIVANTKDPIIGKGCKRDVKAVRHLFGKITGFINFPLVESLIEGDRYTQQNILNALDGIQPNKWDCVIFYYTGHGFSYEEEASQKFPQMDFRSNPPDSNINVVNAHTKNLTEIFEMIKAKGARLNLVIGDCCNSLIDFKRQYTSDKKVVEEKFVPVNMDFCKRLFNGIGSSVMVAAAKKGQYAISDDAIGSLYTYSLLKKLKDQITSPEPIRDMSWESLLNLAKTETLKESATYDNGHGKPSRQESIFVIEKK